MIDITIIIVTDKQRVHKNTGESEKYRNDRVLNNDNVSDSASEVFSIIAQKKHSDKTWTLNDYECDSQPVLVYNFYLWYMNQKWLLNFWYFVEIIEKQNSWNYCLCKNTVNQSQ